MTEQINEIQPAGKPVTGEPVEDISTASEVLHSPKWDRSVKIVVALVTLVLVAIVAARFTDMILRVVGAAIIAYVLTPLVNLVAEETPLRRGTAILVIYLLLVLLLLGGAVLLGVSTFNQVVSLIESIPTLVENVIEWLSTTEVVSIGPFEIEVANLWGTIDWQSIGDQLLSALVPIVNQGGRTIVVILGSTVEVVTVILFVFIISIYLAFEMGRLGGYASRAIYQPGYRQDLERILREFYRIWQAYLRGQIVLGLVIGGAVWVSLSILGVQNAFGLGVLSGVLEFLPVIGPFIGTVAAALVAIFQPANYLGLSPLTYMLIVVGVMMIIQQIENNILVPRIVGEALDLHPLVVIIGVFMGGSLAGLIGAILAAPVLATIKLLGSYAWRKMFDLTPFPEPEKPPEPPRPSLFSRIKNFRIQIGRYR